MIDIKQILLYLISFLVFAIIQAIAINGVYVCFRGSEKYDGLKDETTYEGMIFYMIAPKFFERYKHRWWASPLWGCIKCMSSFWGALTYWPTVIYFCGLRLIEVPVFIADVFILVYLNFYFYQKA